MLFRNPWSLVSDAKTDLPLDTYVLYDLKAKVRISYVTVCFYYTRNVGPKPGNWKNKYFGAELYLYGLDNTVTVPRW